MFTVTIDKKEYKVSFYHIRPEDKDAVGFKKSVLKNGITFCSIICEETKEIYYGCSPACSFDDNFDRNKGRKYALVDALKSFSPDSNIRQLFWEKYFETRHNKK